MKKALNDNSIRKIKIQPRYFPRVLKDVIFPEIRLAGKWLKDAGFVCGQSVIITQTGNSITITAMPETQSVPAVVKVYKTKSDDVLSESGLPEKLKRDKTKGRIIDMHIRPSQIADSGSGS